MGSISKECPKCCPTCADVQDSAVYNCFNVGNLAATRWRIGCGSWAHEMLLTVRTPEQGRLFGRGADITNETIKKNEGDEQVALKQLVLRQEGWGLTKEGAIGRLRDPGDVCVCVCTCTHSCLWTEACVCHIICVICVCENILRCHPHRPSYTVWDRASCFHCLYLASWSDGSQGSSCLCL